MNAAAHALPLTHRPWWPWARRAVVLGFLVGVAALLVRQARTIDWSEVLQAMGQLPPGTLLAAAALAACSFAIYSSYDLLGRHLTGHKLGTGTVMGVTFISYAFNLNLGSTVGGIGFRFRLYSRLGLKNETITRILGFSMLTNWAGYLVAAGIAFAFWPPALPPDWKIGTDGLRIAGGAALLVALAYVLFCAWAHERTWRIRGHLIEPPSVRMALLQLGMSCLNWSLIGAVVWTLLQGKVDYPHVLAVLLTSAMAGLIVRVPAGLGVLEAVFVALLAYQVPQGQLLAALLAYRGIYYLAPLLLATVAYGITEMRARKLRAPGKSAQKRCA
ncbi:lysylphosphatidylglycerol synthase domain-containing protein [Variovorax sp. J22R133]|uniref:lysylphosphatidylglycerol synthase domain-containing protein n=1 Tax=Variovorax brevis TaxID=3053503 RepID=UPI002577E769|nr:lysylphosphatidylglycerol synthase domain-containing protein [Variovorax sp. J22R133]MDM0111731.1 lysylphosphatidylglycerol synthase domain-containing protein [Variovorax sp. J22R133]